MTIFAAVMISIAFAVIWVAALELMINWDLKKW